MGTLKEKLTDYKNFWLIWLSCAGHEKGISLFRIQTTWGIQTNYLYHKEAGLGKPLFKLMAEQGYMDIAGNKIRPKFEWIPDYVSHLFHMEKPTSGWSPELAVKGGWPLVQPFMERRRTFFFDLDNLRILYKSDKDMLGTHGRYVFQHIFLYVLFSNLVLFSKRYHAEIVTRMISTSLSLGTGADVLNYMYHLHSQIGGSGDFPVLVKNETELAKMLCPLKW
ncbi:MAG: hypothetical protein JXC85_03880 [Candidatus Aenigmarchaeota archaeon]|nr:hypothetical protein [Candidatus Aenigmarchaeota archaeon]